jgi:toxin YhaV
VSDATFQVNGWTIYAHPLFLDQLEAMTAAVDKTRKKDPAGYKKKRATKLLLTSASSRTDHDKAWTQ